VYSTASIAPVTIGEDAQDIESRVDLQIYEYEEKFLGRRAQAAQFATPDFALAILLLGLEFKQGFFKYGD
jgi:hypothetical protein